MQIENIAKRTMDKIQKTEEKLEALIAKRDDFQQSVDTKIAEMNENIKAVEKELSKLREQEKTEKLAAIGSALSKKGVDVNTLLAAVASNDLYAIQDILEGNSAPAPASVSEQNESSEPVSETENTNYSEKTAESGYNYGETAENDAYMG